MKNPRPIAARLLPWALMLSLAPLAASDLRSVKPVHERIIQLHFVDGFIEHAKLGQVPWEDARICHRPLDLLSAAQAGSYTIASEDDPFFAGTVHPLRVFRKSKGVDFVDRVEAEGKQNHIVLGHWIYLELPKAMERGNRYEISFPGLQSEDFPPQVIHFDEEQIVSDSVRVNQVGYSDRQRFKFGYVYHWMGDGGAMKLESPMDRSFRLVDAESGETVFTGTVAPRRVGELPGPAREFHQNDVTRAHVYECDFSAFSVPGGYRLVVAGIGSSFPFRIGPDAYFEAYYTAVRGLFHHRSGIERTIAQTRWIKPVEHRPGVNGFSIEYSLVKHMDGGNNFTGLEEHATGWRFPDAKADWMPESDDAWGWGGYFDAGDYDRHSGHLTAAEYLLFAWELTGGRFHDDELDLPESGNGIPDLIDEARWGVDCFVRLKGPTGGICGGMEENEHPLPGENSVTDSRPWYVYAEEALASMRLASAAAQLAHCLRQADRAEEAEELLREAESAYRWSEQSGDLGQVGAEHQRASAWLHRVTGNTGYLDAFHRLYADGVRDPFALFVYAYDPPAGHHPRIRDEIVAHFLHRADELVDSGARNPLRRIEGAPSGWSTVNFLINVYDLIFAHHLTGDPEYLDYVFTTCGYNLGNNPANRVYVTGLGENPVNAVFNMDSWFDGIEESIPGIVPYGLPTRFIGGRDTVWRPFRTFRSAYPAYEVWPTGELWFENRYLINCNEYTISETIGPAAGAYAYVARIR